MQIIRHYPMAGVTCEDCRGQCDVGKRCPRTSPTTEPGELAPDRERRPVPGSGLVMAICIVCAAAVAVLVMVNPRGL